MTVPAAGKRVRLSAAERRESLLGTACRVFSEGSYRGTTTAEIARAAGVTEPVLYRHFPSKRALYLACVDEAWGRVRSLWERVIDEEPDAARWVPAMGRAIRFSRPHRFVITRLWVQALVEASEDPEIRAYMRRHLREVHAFVADVHRRAQAAGGLRPELDAAAEAWIFLGIGLLRTISDTLGLFPDDHLSAVAASRTAWLTGTEPER